MEPVPFIERVKIWTELLLPFYKRVAAELGEERAAALLRATVKQFGEEMGKNVAEEQEGTSLDAIRSLWPAFRASDALETESLRDDAAEFSLNVRRCEYAQFFKSIGEPAFGAMITCEIDPPINAGIGSDLDMQRTQTIMSGSTHCDFRYKLR